MDFVLPLLTFLFGYYTCHTFYYYKSIRAGIIAVRTAQVVSLAMIVLALQELVEAKTLAEKAKIAAGETEHNINAIKKINEIEISYFKEQAIRKLIKAHPSFFSPIVDFSDWNSAMQYLESNRRLAIEIIDNKGELK